VIEGSPPRAIRLLAALPMAPMGLVFDAEVGGKRVVLAKLGNDEELLERAQTSLALDHPAIARCLELVELDDGSALAQERCAGVPIAEAAANLDAAALIDIVDQVLAAFEHAHAHGVAHGDVRAEDLVLVADQVKVLRFGFARPSRPPAPRYDLVSVGKLLAPLVSDPDVQAVLLGPLSDASTARRNVRQPVMPADSLVSTLAAEQPSVTAADKLVGRRLGDFEIIEKMREGGLGMVFRARQQSLGREAVIKVPLARGGSVPDVLLKRFLAEARLASSLDHPFAAHIYAFGHESDGVVWIAMELVDGTPLDDYVRQTGPMPAARAVAFVERLCQVVHRAHELRIVHRDIKPANVMVMQRSGRLLPKLLDFGIARMFDRVEPAGAEAPAVSASRDSGSEQLTQQGSTIGSPLYMSPEQWDDASGVGPAADIYALGVLTYELLAGKPPFKASSIAAIATAHMHDPVPSLGSSFAPELDAVLARAMAKDPAQRFATALELGAALTAAAGLSEEAALPPPRLPDAIRADVLAGGPPPLAASLLTLEAARNVHQARSALDQAVDVTASWLGVIALLARSRLGPGDGDSERARALVRELGVRVLEPAEWLELARALCAPYFDRPALHPLGELVIFFRDRAELFTRVLERRTESERILDEAAVREALTADVAAFGNLLSALGFLNHLRVVTPRDAKSSDDVAKLTLTITRAGTPRATPSKLGDSRRCEVWAGTHREIRPAAALGAGFDPTDIVYIDADGAPVLKLAPLVQRGVPIPGQPDVLFVFAGTAAGSGRLVAAPHGFTLADPRAHEWLRTQVLEGAAGEAPAAAAERSPYRGLAAFTAADADLFVGREKEQAVCLNRLRVQPLVAVVGRSGAGKSSFVHAGVLPGLPAGWLHVSTRPGAAPLTALRARLGDLVPPSIADGELAAALIMAAAARQTTLVLVIDQFEELFTLCHDEVERDRFAELLARLAVEGSPVRVILTLRDDFLIAAEQLTALRDRIGPNVMLLTTPGRSDLERILREPVARVGYTFDDPDLPARMVREVGEQPGALALISFAADELWQRRDRHFKRLTKTAYEAMNGVTGALVGHAEKLIAGLSTSEVTLVREVFRRLVTTDGTRAVVARRDILEVLGQRAAIIEKLVQSRLVVASEGIGGDEQLEVAHETLLQTWPRLVQWRGEDAEGARMREELRTAAKQWDARKRPVDLLWRGDALIEYRLWRQRHPDGLTSAESAFADASVAHERRAVWRRRVLLSGAFLALAGFSVALWTLKGRADTAARETKQRLIASYIDQARTKLQDGRRWQALARVIAAQKLGASGPVLDTMRALARAPALALEHRIAANHGRTWNVRYSPDGKLLASAGDDGAALWRADTGALVTRLAKSGEVVDAVFDSVGARLATQGGDGSVRIFDVASGRRLRVLDGHHGVVRCLAWRADGRWLASGSEDGTVKVWDPATGELHASFTTEGEQRATACAFSGDTLAVGTGSGQVMLIATDAGTSETLGHHADWARALQFDGTGTRLVTASADRTVRVWDVPARKQLAELHGAGDALIAVALSPDGKEVVASGRDARAYVWDVASGALRLSLAGHKGVVWHVEYSRDGSRIVTSADDGSARIWDAQTGGLLATFDGHDAAVVAARFSVDGTQLATASYDGTVVTWHATAMNVVGRTPGPPGPMCNVSSSADARWIAVACDAATTVWDTQANRPVATLPGANIAVATDTHVFGVSHDRAHVWALHGGAELATFALPEPPLVIGASRDRFAVVDGSNHITLYDMRGTPVANPPMPVQIEALARVPEIEWLAIGHDVTVPASGVPVRSSSGTEVVLGFQKLWIDEHDGPPFPLEGHHAATWAASFDATGKRLVSTSEDGGGIVWDVEHHSIVCRLVSGSQFFAGAVFDESGRIVIALDGTGSLQLFDSASGDPIGTLAGKMRRPVLLRRALDGTLLAFGGGGDVVAWRVPPDAEPLAAAERDLACKAPENERVGTCSP
jgi:WD40 repeat protein/serine/threonine protein kinase